MPSSFHIARVRSSGQDPHPPARRDSSTEHVPFPAPCHHESTQDDDVHKTPDRSSDPFAMLEEYLREKEPAPIPVSVCFKNVSTWGTQSGATTVKTVWDAILRTLTMQEIYECSLKRIISPQRMENGRPLIKDFTGVVRSGEMMLVLGNPGSGCSTFLRTIGNDHASFLGITGSIDYSGLSPREVTKNCRGLVSYVPEDDVHLPTLTVRQTLEFALRNKTPKRRLAEVPKFLETFGKVFGMTHVMDTLVGNEFLRGVSGGERKRVSIMESLASDTSVNCWDGSTRGLDASSAVDYIRSLRIITDACQRATVVSIYQASDAIYELMDKVMLIDQGRMLYQGPASQAEAYFNALGYQRLPRQTVCDFLTSIPLANPESIMPGFEKSVPRGAANLENAFRASQAFKDIQAQVSTYEADLRNSNNNSNSSSTSSLPPQPRDSITSSNSSSSTKAPAAAAFQNLTAQRKSRFVSPKSSYNTSFVRQTLLCSRREIWQLRGHKAPYLTKFLCIICCAFLLGSMFYKMPDNTDGVYSRGGFSFYSAVLVAWFQLAELETAFNDRDVVSRQKRYAAVRPAAVVAGKTLVDVGMIIFNCLVYAVVAYFLSGMRSDASSFFGFTFATVFSAMSYTAFFRVFGAASPRIEIALRYCGLMLLVTMVCGGYVRSIDKLMSDVPWVGWLAYTNPGFYAYEIIMALEFHNRDFTCSPASIIPAGSTYNNSPAFQTCASKGVLPGQLHLNGDSYIQTQFGFSFNNIGRDFGILISFTVALLALNMWLVEKVDWASGTGGALEFSKINNNESRDARSKNDEEATSGDETPVPSAQVVEKPSRQAGSDSMSGLVESKSTFTWRSIDYTVTTQNGEKKLLSNVSGYCEPGSLTALVGASGAGKSTLMTVLTQQATGKVTGAMKINGHDIDPSFGREIGYCQQMDIHIETSTVREAFEFSALLRQPARTSKADKLAYVDTVIDILGMAGLQHAVIRSLSLEQKKRTTIGVELCAKPSLLLFLDEPTSGLDSQGAMNIVNLLRRLADAGQAIICTIHQASQEQFEQFDRVLALNRGGKVYYFGDIGSRGKTILEYFSRHGHTAEPDKNVADLLIEVTAHSNDFEGEEGEGEEAGPKQQHRKDWCQIWAESGEAAAVLGKIDREASATKTSPLPPPSGQPQSSSRASDFESSTLQQTILLTQRTMVQYIRTPDYIYSRLYCSVAHAGLNGLAFLQLSNSVAAMQYRVFSCFLILMVVPEFVSAISVMFVDNRNIWLGRELPSRIYGWKAFATAQIVSEIPFALAGGVLFYVIFYFLVGLPLGVPAVYTFLMMMMFHLFSTSWGQWIAAFSADAVMAASIFPFPVILCELFNGVLQPQSLMPAVWAYTAYYISPFTYWIRGILAAILPGLTVRCLDSELHFFNAPSGGNMTCGEYASDWTSSGSGFKGYLSNLDAVGEQCGYCQYAVGDDFLSSIDLKSSDAWPWLGIFALFTFTNYLCVYGLVYVKSVKNWLPW